MSIPSPAASRSRRQREPPPADTEITEALSAKVLHGWLQNRHQTLYPLTVNLRTLEGRQPALLAQVMAVALLSGTAPPEAARIEPAAAWLGSVGGDETAREALRTALELPPPLSRLLWDVSKEGLSAYAFIAALVGADSRDAAARLFLDYLAARLALPPDIVRSARRRYRR
jgi:hypothetical protein